MRRSVVMGALLAAALGGLSTAARASGSDVVQIRGRTFRGTIVENRPHVLVTIRLDDGSQITAPWSEVVAIDQRSEPSSAATPSAAAPETAPPETTPPKTTPPRTTPPRTPVPDTTLPETTPPESPRHWYGWQTLLVDAGSLALLVAGAEAQSSVVGGLAGMSYAAGPSFVHLAHGRGVQAIGDVLIRVGVPVAFAVAGGLIAVDTSSPNESSEEAGLPNWLGGAALGLVIGVVTAVAIDAAALAWEPRTHASPSAGGGSVHVTLMPRLTFSGDAERGRTGWIGLGGSF
jgi:hypothetical protein